MNIPKKPKTKVTHVPETASESQGSEETQEEERTKKFVVEEMEKEILQVENDKALKRQEKENEEEISDFLIAARNQSSQKDEHTTGQESAENTKEEEVELVYMTSHGEYEQKVIDRANSPNRDKDTSGNEYMEEHEVNISPLYEDNYVNLDTNVPRSSKIKEEVVEADQELR